MAEVQPRDILLRVGRNALLRGNALVLGGARGRLEELKETFSRTTVRRFRDRDGIGRTAAVNTLGIEYPAGLVDQFGNPLGTIPITSVRTQLVVDPENFGAWAIFEGTPTRTAGQADPFGGTAAYLLDDNDGATLERINQVVAFTGNAEKCVALFVRQGTSAVNNIWLWDQTALAARHKVTVTWTAGVPALTTAAGAGTRFTPVSWGGGWWFISFSATGVVAANDNRFIIDATDGIAASIGTVYIFGANAWDAIYPTSYQGPGGTPSGADNFSVPVNFGRIVCSLYFDIVEQMVHDAASDTRVVALAGNNFTGPYFCVQSQGVAGYRAIFDNGAGIVGSGQLSTGAFGDRARGVARLYSDGSCELERRINNGAAATSSRSAASTLTSGPWNAQKLQLGRGNGVGDSNFPAARGFIDAMVVRDTHSLAECEAAL